MRPEFRRLSGLGERWVMAWMDEQRRKHTQRVAEGPMTELVQYSKTIRQMRRASEGELRKGDHRGWGNNGLSGVPRDKMT